MRLVWPSGRYYDFNNPVRVLSLPRWVMADYSRVLAGFAVSQGSRKAPVGGSGLLADPDSSWFSVSFPLWVASLESVWEVWESYSPRSPLGLSRRVLPSACVWSPVSLLPLELYQKVGHRPASPALLRPQEGVLSSGLASPKCGRSSTPLGHGLPQTSPTLS